MLRRLIVDGFLSLLAVFGITTAVAIPAGAATPGCTHGAFAGHCGTQTDQKNHAGEPGRVPPDRARAGQPLVAFLNSDTDKALDFAALQPGTSTVSAAELMLPLVQRLRVADVQVTEFSRVRERARGGRRIVRGASTGGGSRIAGQAAPGARGQPPARRWR